MIPFISALSQFDQCKGAKAVPDNKAQYNKATTKVDCNKELASIIMAGHSTAKVNVAKTSLCKFE